MSIRLRRVDGELIAICAARSIPKPGDMYLDDGVHHALAIKFGHDFAEERGESVVRPTAVEAEESNNPNREWWDRQYGKEPES